MRIKCSVDSSISLHFVRELFIYSVEDESEFNFQCFLKERRKTMVIFSLMFVSVVRLSDVNFTDD